MRYRRIGTLLAIASIALVALGSSANAATTARVTPAPLFEAFIVSVKPISPSMLNYTIEVTNIGTLDGYPICVTALSGPTIPTTYATQIALSRLKAGNSVVEHVHNLVLPAPVAYNVRVASSVVRCR